MSYLIFYVPITLVVMIVLEACKRDDPRQIAKRSLANFGVLTGVLALMSIVVFFVNKYF